METKSQNFKESPADIWSKVTPEQQEICSRLKLSGEYSLDIKVLSFVGEYDRDDLQNKLSQLVDSGIVVQMSYVDELEQEINDLKNPDNKTSENIFYMSLKSKEVALQAYKDYGTYEFAKNKKDRYKINSLYYDLVPSFSTKKIS